MSEKVVSLKDWSAENNKKGKRLKGPEEFLAGKGELVDFVATNREKPKKVGNLKLVKKDGQDKELSENNLREGDFYIFKYLVEALGQPRDEKTVEDYETVFVKSAKVVEYDENRDLYRMEGVPVDRKKEYFFYVVGEKVRDNVQERMKNAWKESSFKKDEVYFFHPGFRVDTNDYVKFAKFLEEKKESSGRIVYRFLDKNPKLSRTFYFDPTEEN